MNSKKKYALLSVSDKRSIVDLAKTLQKNGYSIISTGGTAKELGAHKIPVIPIQEVTGNPESFDGRMKTISFQVESGILFDRKNPKHLREAKTLFIKPIDIVVCNLYPFAQTIAKKEASITDAIENIDVGGPTMIRAAAKNFAHVVVLVDPDDYREIGESIAKKSIPIEKRQALAAKAFGHLSFYDSQIAAYLGKNQFPEEITLPGKKLMDLRYGENAQQQAAVYTTPNNASPFNNIQKLWGRDLSLTNIADINAGLEAVRLFNEPAAAVIKHNNPCGIATGASPKEALQRAIEADPESAFGGVIILNTAMDLRTAKVIAAFKEAKRGNMDIVAVPEISKDALQLLSETRKSMGIYTFGKIASITKPRYDLKWIDGGFMVQTRDDGIEDGFKDWKIVTKKRPSKKQIEQMQFAWKCITRIKSNAILIVDPEIPMTRGIGSGQTSRIRSTKIALEQAGEFTNRAILASDSFFPFDDSVMLAAKHGISAIVQQGGSINDKASIEAADKAGISMAFTGRRAFWH